MSAGPVVSVVTPVYNGERHLEECIQSVLSQTYSDFEYIVMDNASTDGTAAIAERFASQDRRIRVVHATEFLEIYGNFNRALREMDPQTRYCKIVYADDWLYPECLERMIAVAERHPSVGLVTSYRLEETSVKSDGVFTYSEQVRPGPEIVRKSVLHWATGLNINVIGSSSSVLYRADLVRGNRGFFDEQFWYADAEAAFRVLTVTDLGFVHQVLTYTRMHPNSLSMFSFRVWSPLPQEGRLLLRFGPKVLDPDEHRTALRRWLVRYGIWLLKQSLKPSRHRQRELHEFHQREIDHLMAEAGDDRMTRLTLRLYRWLLHDVPRTSPAPSRALTPGVSNPCVSHAPPERKAQVQGVVCTAESPVPVTAERHARKHVVQA